MQTKIVVLDCREYGQPDDVAKCWQECFEAKGISYFTTEPIEAVIDELDCFGIVILGSAAGLKPEHAEAIKNYVKCGGCLIASGALGTEDGIIPALEELFGIKSAGITRESLIPFLVNDMEPFRKEDALLFLHDKGPKPVIRPEKAGVIGGSLKWDPEAGRYTESEKITIVSNEFGRGKTLYVNLGLGDRKRTPPLVSGQWVSGEPVWPSDDSEDAPVKNRMGYPLIRDTQPELSIFLLSLVCFISNSSLAWIGHWPNGWNTVVSLTGDVHGKEMYGSQIGTTQNLAESLKESGLDGLFTFTVTANAVEEAPDLLRNLIKRGYHIVPHSAYTAIWMFNLSREEQEKEIDKCIQVYRKLLPNGQSLLGWRSHGWSANGDTEKVLDEKGFLWISDLHTQHYGDFGEKDIHLPKGEGVAMISVPEKPAGMSILRLPQTYYSIWWIGYALGRGHGVSGDVNKGGPVWDLACKLVEEKFYKDIRFEALHLSDWHPEEEFVRVPQFAEKFKHMCQLWKTTENVGIMQATDVARWWLWRENILVKEINSEDNRITVTCDFPSVLSPLNPTIRLNIGDISGIVLDDRIEWRYFGRNWVALPVGLSGVVEFIIEKGEVTQPSLVDSTSIVKEAYFENNELKIVVSETRQAKGRITLYIPELSDVVMDGKTINQRICNYQTFSYEQGDHVFIISSYP